MQDQDPNRCLYEHIRNHHENMVGFYNLLLSEVEKTDDFQDINKLQRLAKAGNADAQWKLGLFCMTYGRYSNEFPRSFVWFAKAAEQGHQKAIILLTKLADTSEEERKMSLLQQCTRNEEAVEAYRATFCDPTQKRQAFQEFFEFEEKGF